MHEPPAVAVARFARAGLPLLLTACLLTLLGCNAGASARQRDAPSAQALRTCVDRWNEARMRDWGPALASVGRRRLDSARLAELGLRPGPRRCVVSVTPEYRLKPGESCSTRTRTITHGTCVDRSRTWTCAIGRFGAYVCPLRHETDPFPLRNENGRVDARGNLNVNVPLRGTHAPPQLAWQRHPHLDGWVEPWTRSGTLRSGLRFTSTYGGGGFCDPGSEETSAKSAVRCVWRGIYRVDPCFAPPGRWNRRGGVVACAHGPGATTFARFVIGPPSYRAVDLPILAPWSGIGAIMLGESRARVRRDYDEAGHRYHVQGSGNGIVQGYYALHRRRVYVTFRDRLVDEIDFTSRFYRAPDGFGVGSRIPLGPCHRTATASCEHRWRGFVWNAWVRERPCSCWVKVGDRARSLSANAKNFLEQWVFIYVRRGRVTRVVMARRFID